MISISLREYQQIVDSKKGIIDKTTLVHNERVIAVTISIIFKTVGSQPAENLPKIH